jgi:hypothetical protein
MLVVLLAMTTPFHSEVRLTGSRQAELRGAVVPGPAEIAMACLNQCVSGKSADCVARLSDRSRPILLKKSEFQARRCRRCPSHQNLFTTLRGFSVLR